MMNDQCSMFFIDQHWTKHSDRKKIRWVKCSNLSVKCSQSFVVHIFSCDVHKVLPLMFTYCSKAQAFWLLGGEDLARQGLNISCSLEREKVWCKFFFKHISLNISLNMACSLEGGRERKSDEIFSSNIFLWIFRQTYFFEYFFE